MAYSRVLIFWVRNCGLRDMITFPKYVVYKIGRNKRIILIPQIIHWKNSSNIQRTHYHQRLKPEDQRQLHARHVTNSF